MADPLTAIGSASAIVQLIGGLASGLRMLKDVADAINDAPKAVERLQKNILHLGHCLKILEQYFQQRAVIIPFEAQLRELIQEIATDCTAPLEILKANTPTRLPRKKAIAALKLWLDDKAITGARNQIDEYIPYMNLLIQTLNLFKHDQTDELLHQIASSLTQTAQHRQPSQDTALYEVNHHSESCETTLKGIRTFANDATAFVVQSASTKTETSWRYLSRSRPGDPSTVSSVGQVPAFPKARAQLDHEWDQNRKDLGRLVEFGLFENAEKLQQRALLIKEELSDHHGVLFMQEEREEMEEQLANILIECKVEGSTKKAISLIEKIIGENPRGRATENTKNPLTFPCSSTSDQKKLNLHYKLGRLYKETEQLDLAEKELRTAFNAYAYSEEIPRDVPVIRQAGEELSELYERRVEFGDTDHRSVFLSQQQAFKQELRTILGRPLEHRRTACDKALEWCKMENIEVSTEDGEPRFDIPDEEGSSPLHHAAEKCKDNEALQQMMENSDTLENEDSNGDTPLFVAVSCSNIIALTVLLQKGASVKARDSQHQTPLHRSRKPSVTEFLLSHRVRRASTMTSGLFDDARRFSSSSSSTFTTFPPSSIADQDLDINAQDAHKKTAIYLACHQGREKTLEHLLRAGADPNIAAHDHTPLAATIESQARAYIKDPQKRINIVAALVSRGADTQAGKQILKKPRGMEKEILKALEGRIGSPLLQNNFSEDWSIESRRDSGYQQSVSSAASKPQLDHLEFGPAFPSGFDKPEE